MGTFHFSSDEGVARRFYERVLVNLCCTVPVDDEETGETTTVRKRCGFGEGCGPDLFTLRGVYLGCVYYEIEKKIAGLYCLTTKDGKAYVDSGWVAHKIRGKGIGFTLLQRACDSLIERGKTPVHFIIRSPAMHHLVDKLDYPTGTIVKEAVGYDDNITDLEDFLLTEDEWSELHSA